jgi:hypothetical protein
MDKRLASMLDILEHMRKRPDMWIGSRSVSSVNTFLTGFDLASQIFAPEFDSKAVYREIVASRGWEAASPQPVWHQMQEQGFKEQAIVDEILTIEYEVWKKIASRTTMKLIPSLKGMYQ